MFLIVFLFALWSSTFAISKATLAYASPVFLTAVRMLLAAFIILGYLLFQKRAACKLSKKEIAAIAILGVLNIYLVNILEFWGLKYLSASKTCFIYSLSPFFAAFFSYLHFKEKMTRKKWLGMLIGFAGILPILYVQSKTEFLSGQFFSFSLAELAVAGAALLSVYSWVLLRILVKDHKLSPLTANGYSMLLGGVLALFHSFFTDIWQPTPLAAGKLAPFFGGISAIVLISNVVGYNLYGYLLKKYTATFLSFMGLLSPFFASVSSYLILKEPISPAILGATCVVVLGLWIHYQEELKQGYIVKNVKNKAKQKSVS